MANSIERVEYDRIKCNIQNLANDIFRQYEGGNYPAPTKETAISIYTNVCSWLLNAVKFFIDSMVETRQNVFKREYTDYNVFNGWAFSTYFDEKDDTGYLKIWQSMGFELPYNLVQRIIKEKGYCMRVTEKKHREHLYASLTTTYTLEIMKDRIREREQ